MKRKGAIQPSCPSCAAKDEVIAVLREQLTSATSSRDAAHDKILSMADPMAMARVTATQRPAKPQGETATSVKPPAEKRAASMAPEHLTPEQREHLARAKEALSKDMSAPVSAPPRRDEIESEFKARADA
jgi:hypothetical protein